MIQKEDILKIAKELNIEVDEKRINEILTDYPDHQQDYCKDDPWYLIVEDMLNE